MRVFVTGATGFLGGHVVRRLRARGDEVVALVRDPRRAAALGEGVHVVHGDLDAGRALLEGIRGADAVVHTAAMYEVGVSGRRRRRAMYLANVVGTQRVLALARDAGVPRIAYVSTIAVFGNTHGEVVDETYVRGDARFTSYYDETKTRAHEIARAMAGEGAPIVIVQPGQLYGRGDHSGFGGLLGAFARGRLPVLPFPDLGLNLSHVDDVADGITRALGSGRPGHSYVLGGEIVRARDAFAALARVVGRPAPRWELPYLPLDLAALLVPAVGEIVRSAKGVTFWATDARARAELGYAPRPLEQGLRETYAG